MIPDDESVRRAMQSIEPAGAEVPELFDRVAAGARRRRRQRSTGAVIAAALVVAVVALVPALGRGSSSAKVNSLGAGGSATSTSSALSSSAVVSPATVVSRAAVASSAQAVHSSAPPLSNSPPPPSLVTTGPCSGLTVAMLVADTPASPAGITSACARSACCRRLMQS
jgi:hypothetical protein